LQIDFPEAMTGMTNADIVVNVYPVELVEKNGVSYTPINFVAAAGNAQFTATISPPEGWVVVYVPAGSATDSNSNINAFSNTLSWWFDTTGSVPTLSSSLVDFKAGNELRTQTNPIPVTVNFDEKVRAFTVNDITVSGGTITNFAPILAYYNYTVDFTPTTQGVAGYLSVNAAVTQDQANNPNVASNTIAIVLDTSAPTVVIAAVSALNAITGTVVTNTYPFHITVQFSEAMYNFSQYDVTMVNGYVTDILPDNTTVSDNYLIYIIPTGQLNITVSYDAS
jgi:hypothetical protein